MTALETGPMGARCRGGVLGLAAREEQILGQVALGMSNAGIAETLSMSSRTIEHYVARIYAKLGIVDSPEVNRRVQAVLMYLAAASMLG